MYIEMELLARERYQTRLREAEEMHRNLRLADSDAHSRAPRNLPMPRVRQR